VKNKRSIVPQFKGSTCLLKESRGCHHGSQKKEIETLRGKGLWSGKKKRDCEKLFEGRIAGKKKKASSIGVGQVKTV